MKEETGATSRPPTSRIDIGRSLSIGKIPPKSTDSTSQNNSSTTASEASADAAKLSLSKIFDGVKIPDGPSKKPITPQPIASGREAAKAQYLRQSAGIESANGSAGRAELLQAEQSLPEPAVGSVLQQIQERLQQYDIDESEDESSGDSAESLEPFARKYVSFLEQTGQSYSATEREAKVKEVSDFYSAPTRQGRLQALVEEI